MLLYVEEGVYKLACTGIKWQLAILGLASIAAKNFHSRLQQDHTVFAAACPRMHPQELNDNFTSPIHVSYISMFVGCCCFVHRTIIMYIHVGLEAAARIEAIHVGLRRQLLGMGLREC